MKRILLGFAVLFSFVMLSCDQSHTPSGPSPGPANKAYIDREFNFAEPVFISCCGVEEEVLLTGVVKFVANANGRHYVMKDLVGICMYGGHTYTTQATSVGNVRDDNGVFQLTFNVKLISEEGCRIVVKLHYKTVYNEETGMDDYVYDHSEVICEPGDRI